MVVLLVARHLAPTCRGPTHVEPRQAPYLNVPFLYVRMLVGLALLWWLSRDLVRAVAAHRRPPAQELRGPRAQGRLREAGRELARRRGRGRRGSATGCRMRAPQIVRRCTRSCFTVLAWDFIMSLTPEWVSTLFGWWFFMGAFLTGIAMTAFLATQLRGQATGSSATSRPTTCGTSARSCSASASSGPTSSGPSTCRSGTPTCPRRPAGCSCASRSRGGRSRSPCSRLVFVIPFLGLLNKYTKKTPVLAGAVRA